MIDRAQLNKDTDNDHDTELDTDKDGDQETGNDGDGDKDPGGEPKGLTNWKNPPSLSDLKQDLQDARSSHSSQVTKISSWLNNLHVSGPARMKAVEGNSSIQPKLIRKQAEWRYAALTEPYLSTDDVFKVKPVTWEDREAAQQNQLVLNNQFNTKINKVGFIDELIRTLVDEGTAIVRVGWETQEETTITTVPKFEYIADPSYGQRLLQLHSMQQESPSQFETDVPDEDKQALALSTQHNLAYRPNDTGETEEISKRKVLKNCPTVEVCDYRNIVIDPTCHGDIEKAGFAIYSFETSLAQLTKDGKYSNLDKIQVENNGPLSEPDHQTDTSVAAFQFNDKPRKKIVVYEYWGFWDIDGNGTTKPIVAAWVGDRLIRMDENPYPDKQLPFVIFQYLPVRKATHGEPDGVLIEDNQKIAGAITRGMIDIMAKSANGQTGVRKDMLDSTNKRKFLKGEDYEFNQNVDPRAGVHMHVFPEIPQSAAMMLGMQNQEAESLTGVKSFSQGVSGNALGDVAAGVRGALDAASKRELGILRRISAGMVAIGRKFISMNAEFLEPEEVVRITNEEFVTVRRDDLPGNFDLKIGVSTAEEDEKKAQELAMMLQTMGPNMDPDMTKMILSDIARLRKMPDLAHKIEQFKPQPDPFTQQKQQLELTLLQAQIATEQAKAAQLGANAQLHGSKVGTEMAKQDHLKSDTDLKNLDFVEQEKGVKQERDLQKAGAQADSQGNLAILQHHLDVKAAKEVPAAK